ncbi:hypothetical protein H0G86_011424 [Trichoderma simmonsii]|uniref:Uncharacterized protein n=1 Tax=Trichoderma simmonsii TaxID=1491479 RepID=A0A8G0PJ90_9HYPO|nr:hypothetical protein H0G86_011424 [Trichoderma simmonsii]
MTETLEAVTRKRSKPQPPPAGIRVKAEADFHLFVRLACLEMSMAELSHMVRQQWCACGKHQPTPGRYSIWNAERKLFVELMMKIVEGSLFDVCVCARHALIRRSIVHLILYM